MASSASTVKSKEAAKAAISKAKSEDSDGGNTITKAEQKEIANAMGVSEPDFELKYDSNKDGIIDGTEVDKLAEDIEKMPEGEENPNPPPGG